MIQKYFPRDKNYLLKESQDSTRSSLLSHLLSSVKKGYIQKFNPLGLDDPISQKVKNSRRHNLNCLYEFYDSLAAVYRFKYGENQLQFLFDGRTHVEKYSEDWTEAFRTWVEEFCLHENFIKATLELTLILPSQKNSVVMANRMKTFLTGYFDIKIYKNRGIIQTQAA